MRAFIILWWLVIARIPLQKKRSRIIAIRIAPFSEIKQPRSTPHTPMYTIEALQYFCP